MPRVEPTLLAAQIRRIAPGDALTDAELAGRYAEHRDAAAFEVLVWRHGPMVWATCRRVLRHQQDVEDAFQATFLTLARAAGTLGSRQAVAGWLHRVAMNSALNMKAQRRSTGLTDDISAPPAPDGELSGAVDEELERLPHRMRAAFVLCCLEGMTSAEAARELGCPVGTVDSRLHAARTRLRDRLTRRGLGPTAILVGATGAAPSATATLPAPWVMTALRHATVPGAVPNNINLLATGVLKSMSASKLKSAAALLLVSGALLIGGGFGLAHLTGQPEDAPDEPGAPKGSPMAAAPDPVKLPEEWSKSVNGLQARVVLVEKPRSNGTRMLHPYLELRNVSDMAYPLKVRLGGAHVKFELVDADGKVVDDGQRGARDGPYPDPGTISLPLDSSLRVGMFCTNWGVPRDAAAMIATDSGAWVLKPEQEGKVFLRVKVSGKKQDEDERVWFGDLEAKARVTWSGEAPRRAQPTAAAEKGPKLWAAISINQPVFLQDEETGPGLFQIQFTVVNDGDAVIDPEIESSQLIINGKEFKDWKLVIGNGPRTGEWKALPAGRYVQFGYALGSYFNEPGVYKVSWKGKHFESPEIVFRVMPKKVK
ncbi:MAG TPA: RNA polymerase sigma factor [Gemmataceae bacterium]|nr:RNA polymerase sigma factor [Gemmataceae bacterium]